MINVQNGLSLISAPDKLSFEDDKIWYAAFEDLFKTQGQRTQPWPKIYASIWKPVEVALICLCCTYKGKGVYQITFYWSNG